MPDPNEEARNEEIELEDTVEFKIHDPDENPHDTTHEHTESDGHDT